ncbi:hypothetical protein ESA94_03635 [Lacibacter luteus]|uniref:Uncharacterized protein n=1 Tax=Lacibacter luteus TaxID=2508719 RepID=A0A4Q1CM45_9BACT|nr:hypothetical protein [Lacibacter luteus]RXK62117.1 hypothetical protein ESA94_03635 [Lacibacter luteus]
MKKLTLIICLFACIYKVNAQNDSLSQPEIGPLFHNITLNKEYEVWIEELKKQQENFSDTTFTGKNVRAAFIIKNLNPYLDFSNYIITGYIIVGVYTYDKTKKVQYVAVRLKTKTGTTKEQAQDAYDKICAKMAPLFKHALTGTPKKYTIKHFSQQWPPEEITPFEVGYGYDKQQRSWYVLLAIKKPIA